MYLHAALVGPLLERHTSSLELLGTFVYVLAGESEMSEAVLLLVPRMDHRALLGLRAVIVSELDGHTIGAPEVLSTTTRHTPPTNVSQGYDLENIDTSRANLLT
eukprot:1370769-Pyramimonas_sp.AAC.2